MRLKIKVILSGWIALILLSVSPAHAEDTLLDQTIDEVLGAYENSIVEQQIQNQLSVLQTDVAQARLDKAVDEVVKEASRRDSHPAAERIHPQDIQPPIPQDALITPSDWKQGPIATVVGGGNPHIPPAGSGGSTRFERDNDSV